MYVCMACMSYCVVEEEDIDISDTWPPGDKKIMVSAVTSTTRARDPGATRFLGMFFPFWFSLFHCTLVLNLMQLHKHYGFMGYIRIGLSMPDKPSLLCAGHCALEKWNSRPKELAIKQGKNADKMRADRSSDYYYITVMVCVWLPRPHWKKKPKTYIHRSHYVEKIASSLWGPVGLYIEREGSAEWCPYGKMW